MKRRFMRFLRRSSHSCDASFYLCCDWLHVRLLLNWKKCAEYEMSCMYELLRNWLILQRFLQFPRKRMELPVSLLSLLACSERRTIPQHVGVIWWATRLAARDLGEYHRAHVHSWRFSCCSFTKLQISFGCAPTVKPK